ncbi:hypothetical protein FB451DRAFT_1490277 [Mycena latifolia]|nr:hypothetical protein FB451DRAFT_1490277 [Mycena latifolia]
MDRPLGPRAPPQVERHAAYEDIFGRRPVHHQPQRPPPPSAYGPPQQHYPPPAPYAAYPHRPPVYAAAPAPSPAPGPYPGQYYQPSVHRSVHHPYPQGVPAAAPDRPLDPSGLTPAQAYQAQVANAHNGYPRPPPPRSPAPPALSVAVGGEGTLGINFDGPPQEDDDDDESELPWARRECLFSFHSFVRSSSLRRRLVGCPAPDADGDLSIDSAARCSVIAGPHDVRYPSMHSTSTPDVMPSPPRFVHAPRSLLFLPPFICLLLYSLSCLLRYSPRPYRLRFTLSLLYALLYPNRYKRHTDAYPVYLAEPSQPHAQPQSQRESTCCLFSISVFYSPCYSPSVLFLRVPACALWPAVLRLFSRCTLRPLAARSAPHPVCRPYVAAHRRRARNTWYASRTMALSAGASMHY